MLTWYRKVSNLKRTVSTIFFTGNESNFEIFSRNYNHQAYRKVHHQSYKSHITSHHNYNLSSINVIYNKSIINLYGSLNESTQGIIHPLSKVCANLHFLLILLWRGGLCPAHRGSPTSSPSRFYLTSSNRNGSAPKKRVINHFKRTVIYHHSNDSHSTCFLSLRLSSSASCSLSFIIRMTTCREPKSFYLIQVLIWRRCNLLSKGKSYTLEETVIIHIEAKVLVRYSAVK